jgi:hypothetical protein
VDLFMAITQGTGLALATGFRPYLPPILAGVLAQADAGIDFSGTDFAFLESTPFLLVMLALTAAGVFAERRVSVSLHARALGAAAIMLGALLFAGSLADEGYAGGPGLVAGGLVALIGFLAVTTFLGGARLRLATRGEEGAATLILVYFVAASLVMTVVAVFVSPLSLLPLAFCLWLIVARRRRAAQKYEGLRVLR